MNISTVIGQSTDIKNINPILQKSGETSISLPVRSAITKAISITSVTIKYVIKNTVIMCKPTNVTSLKILVIELT